MNTAVCIHCNVEKPTVQFVKDKRRKAGFAGICALCNAKRWRENYYEKKQAQRERINKYRQVRLEQTRKLNRDSYHRNRRSRTDIVYMRRYGITVSDRDRMLVAQEGNCAICGQHESNFKRGFHIDHDHSTGKVRSLLCYRCNRHLVGMHTVETAKKVYEYLKYYETKLPESR